MTASGIPRKPHASPQKLGVTSISGWPHCPSPYDGCPCGYCFGNPQSSRPSLHIPAGHPSLRSLFTAVPGTVQVATAMLM
jgi:hypothetical protein